MPINGQPRKIVMFANRNGFYYTLDRVTGRVILGKPFVKTTWATQLGTDGRPILMPGYIPDEKGQFTCPDITGGTNFWPPAYDPANRLFFVNAREVCATYYAWKPEYTAGDRFTGGAAQRTRDRDTAPYGALRAIDPATGDRKWEFKYLSPSTAGLLTTASGLIFSGDADGNLLALESKTGKLLWRYQMGATLHGTSPVTYMLDGRQQLLVPAGTTLTAWALPEVARQGTK
jgi:alcohol dehydrogenase (cytochrome c)